MTAAPAKAPPVPVRTPARAGVVQRCGGTKCPEGTCDHKGNRLQRSASRPASVAAPPAVHETLRSPGQPLDTATRAFMEPRLGHDFSQVRVHTDARAAASAEAVGASAYTVGSQIVFGAGRYTPATTAGRRLLAHELTHVAQQERGGAATVSASLEVGAPDTPQEREADTAADALAGPAAPLAAPPVVLQRACPPTPTRLGATGPSPYPCTDVGPGAVGGDILLFCEDSDVLLDGQAAWLADIAARASLATAIEVHGNASTDGRTAYNRNLACWRASAVAGLISFVGPRQGPAPVPTLFAHEETSAYGPSPGANRNAVVRLTVPKCGPDATDWFIDQVADAKTQPAVLDVRADLARAGRFAALLGLSAVRIAEGGVLDRVLEEETRAGSPTRTTEATAQIRAAAPGAAEFAAAERAVAMGLIPDPTGTLSRRAAFAVAALLAIRDAAIGWRDLVRTGAVYDFKNDSRTMKNPTSRSCPDDCASTITLCPSGLADCFVVDVPGNLFYAHVGRFVGWSELILQLGSQFAQLDSSARWDPPEDTRMISIGFALPDPLTRGDVCSTLSSNRGAFDVKPCQNCSERTSAAVVVP